MPRELIVDADIVDIMQKLPKICGARLLTDNSPILIKRGGSGYHPAGNIDIVEYNRRHGITAKQVEAMLTGSMFGFDVPGANPDNCDGDIAKDWV